MKSESNLSDALYRDFFGAVYGPMLAAAATSGRLVQFVRAGTEDQPRGERGWPQGMVVNCEAIGLANVVAEWKPLASLADLAAWKRSKLDEPGSRKAAELIEQVISFAHVAAVVCPGPSLPREMNPVLRSEAIRLGAWFLDAHPDHFG
ncbi:hypothetical protein J0H58_08585 [bacterium]|nr:hypothetical protein [bacterium]